MTIVERNYLRDGRAPVPKNVVTSKVMSANRAKNTKPESTLRKALYEGGIRGYRLNWKKAPGRPDIACPGKKIAIFVHGCFWHRCPSCNPHLPQSNSEFWSKKFENNVARDERNLAQLGRMGWRVITVWECEIKNNLKNAVDNIKNHIFTL